MGLRITTYFNSALIVLTFIEEAIRLNRVELSLYLIKIAFMTGNKSDKRLSCLITLWL